MKISADMKTWIEVNKSHLRHNLDVFHKLSQKPLMFVVKGNGYGHGLEQAVKITKDIDFIEYYGVNSADEALKIHELGTGKKIFVMGWCNSEELEELIRRDIEFVVSSEEHLINALKIAEKLKLVCNCHMKIETGTARLGFSTEKAAEIINNNNHDYLRITAVYSHFANIEDTTDHSYAQAQLQCFNKFLIKIKNRAVKKHFSCSASSLIFPDTYFDLIRVGISSYGMWPSKETLVSFNAKNGCEEIVLKPVLSWYASVAQVKEIKAGSPVGYGLTYKTFTDTKIAVIPVGYYEGYDRRFSNAAHVVINNMRAPVRGRICMNMFMVDVTHISDIKQGDPVLILGGCSEGDPDADYMASVAGTINYELLSRINPLIPRVIV